MNRSRIEWCDHEWNPITGCLKGCEKCVYNRFIKGLGGADYRFNLSKTEMYRQEGELMVLDSEFTSETGYKSDYPFGMLPTYHHYRLNRLGLLSTGKNVLCGSIGEMFGYDQRWCYEEIFDTCRNYYQNNYLFLSSGSGYSEMQDILPEDDNMWYGSIIYTRADQVYATKTHHNFIYANPNEDLAYHLLALGIRVDWLVIGTRGCNYGVKIRVPEKEWVDNLIEYAHAGRIPVFVEKSLCMAFGQTFEQEYPDLLAWKSGRRYYGELREKMVGVCGQCKQERLKQDMVAICGRIQRGKQPQQMGFVCKDCFPQICTEFDFKNILGGKADG